MSNNAQRTRTRQVKAWIDAWCTTREGQEWGVEVDEKTMTMDGHFICLTGKGDAGRIRAQIIADALNGRKTPKTKA